MTPPNPPEQTPEVKPAINTNVRLFDLVRYMRAELHEDELITDEEYGWLCAGSPMATSPKGGSPSRERLEDYDELRKQNAQLRAELDDLLERTKLMIADTRRVTGTENEAGPLAADVQIAFNRLRAELEEVRRALAAAGRLQNHRYIDWFNAGGPNECAHSYAEGIPCRECDKAMFAAALERKGAQGK